MPTDLERLTAENESLRCTVDALHGHAAELRAENERMRETLKLHAGDCLSLQGELGDMTERAEIAEAHLRGDSRSSAYDDGAERTAELGTANE